MYSPGDGWVCDTPYCGNRHVSIFHGCNGERAKGAFGKKRDRIMTALAWLIPVALGLGLLGLGAFLWALKSGQFEDLDGAAYRILEDGDNIDETDGN